MAALASLIVVVLRAQATAQVHQPPPAEITGRYVEAIEAYRSGDLKQAEAWATQLLREDIEIGSTYLVEKRRLHLLPAAVMFHTEVFLNKWLPLGAEHYHLARAKWIVARGDLPPDFLLGWYLCLTSYHQNWAELAEALALLEDGLERVGDEPDLRLAVGTTHEMQATLGWEADRNGRRPRRVDVEDRLEAARDQYRRALAVRPDLDEARVRLGRVLHDLGDLEEAAQVLQGLEARVENDRFLGYLQPLFMASLEAARGRFKQAADHYISAATRMPASQAPWVGLSEAYYADGQPDQAATVIEKRLADPAQSDPWWDYLRGQAWRFGDRLTALRKMSQR